MTIANGRGPSGCAQLSSVERSSGVWTGLGNEGLLVESALRECMELAGLPRIGRSSTDVVRLNSGTPVIKEAQLRGLMLQGVAGDAAAYRELLTRLSADLRVYYQRRLKHAGRSEWEADDLVQEALLAIHARRYTYDPEQLLSPWVYAIARYKLLDYLRKAKSPNRFVSVEHAFAVATPDIHTAAESSLDIRNLLVRLPRRMRELVRLVKLEGLTAAEAAAQAGVSEAAVKVGVHRAVRALSAGIAGRKKP